jgi:ribosomal protein L16 Arg81 hydroxylase
VDPATFAAEYWSHRPLLSAGHGDFADLLTLDDVDELISRRGLRTPFLRIAKDGAVVPAASFTRSGGAGAEVADQVADDRVLDLFADGATLVLQGLHRVWPPVIAFAQQLQGELGHPVQVNAYVTPPQNRGFAAHYDVHDVFVLQVAGEKRWLIHPPVLDRPLRDQPWTSVAPAVAEAARAAPAIDTVLRPGDALYLPRGWLHSAEALGDVSCHLTVGVHPVTGYQLVEALAAAAASAPELRASLPLGIDLGDPAQLAPHVAAVLDTLRAWLPTADPDEVAERVRARVWPQSRPEPVGPLAQSAVLRGIDQSTTVRRRAHLVASLRAVGGQVELQLADRRLTLPQSTEPALKALLAGDPVAVSELPGLDPEERLVLVRRLLREAVVVPANSSAAR